MNVYLIRKINVLCHLTNGIHVTEDLASILGLLIVYPIPGQSCGGQTSLTPLENTLLGVGECVK